jgi:hypothetical protein
MTKQSITRLVMISTCIVALVALIVFTPASGKAPAVAAPAVENASEKISIRPVHPIVMGMIGSDVVQAAGSQLIRTKEGVFMTLSTRGLTPGWVYTAWFGIFNNPSECATRPCSGADFGPNPVQGSRVNAGGRIIGPDGSAIYSAFLGVGDTTFAFDGPGLVDPKHAEIHLVVRSHGPALMGMDLANQLTTFNGGCPPNMCANFQISVHAP